MSNGVDEYMDSLDKEHTPSTVPDQGFATYPDSKYQVRLDAIRMQKSKAKEKVQCVMEFEILTGSLAFRTIYKYSNMETVQNLDYLTRDLRTLGIPVDFKWSTVETLFAPLLDSYFEIELKTKTDAGGREFQNCFILKKLERDSVLLGGAIKEPEDDIPF